MEFPCNFLVKCFKGKISLSLARFFQSYFKKTVQIFFLKTDLPNFGSEKEFSTAYSPHESVHAGNV